MYVLMWCPVICISFCTGQNCDSMHELEIVMYVCLTIHFQSSVSSVCFLLSVIVKPLTAQLSPRTQFSVAFKCILFCCNCVEGISMPVVHLTKVLFNPATIPSCSHHTYSTMLWCTRHDIPTCPIHLKSSVSSWQRSQGSIMPLNTISIIEAHVMLSLFFKQTNNNNASLSLHTL